MNFGVIGFGYWGPNVVRNLAALEGSQVLAIAEMSDGSFWSDSIDVIVTLAACLEYN